MSSVGRPTKRPVLTCMRTKALSHVAITTRDELRDVSANAARRSSRRRGRTFHCVSLSSANVPSLMDVSFLDPIETGQRAFGPEGQNGARDPRKDTREVANEARRGSGAMLAGVETKRATGENDA